MRLFVFEPGTDLGWTSGSVLTSSPLPPAPNAVSLCYRAKIYRFHADIYWINLLEYSMLEGDICCELRSREFIGSATTIYDKTAHSCCEVANWAKLPYKEIGHACCSSQCGLPPAP